MTHLDPQTPVSDPNTAATDLTPDSLGTKIAGWIVGGAFCALIVVCIAWVIGWLLANFPQIGG